MCTPVLLAGAALAVGSAVANSIATSQQTRARNDVLAAERIRQQGFDQQTQALNNASRDQFVDFVPQQQQRASDLGDILATKVGTDPNTQTGTVLPSSSSDVVNQEAAKQEGRAQDYVDQQGTALAQMRSFGDLLGDLSTKQARNAAEVNQIGGFKRGSMGLQPLELDNASHAGDTTRLIADLLGGAGSIATSFGVGAPGGSWLTNNLFAPSAATVASKVAGGAASLNPAKLVGGALGVT